MYSSDMKSHFSYCLLFIFSLWMNCSNIEGNPIFGNIFRGMRNGLQKAASSIKDALRGNIYNFGSRNVVIDDKNSEVTPDKASLKELDDQEIIQELEKEANSNSKDSNEAQKALNDIREARLKGKSLSQAIDVLAEKITPTSMKKQAKTYGFGSGDIIGLGIITALLKWLQKIFTLSILSRRKRVLTDDVMESDSEILDSNRPIDISETFLQKGQIMRPSTRRIVEQVIEPEIEEIIDQPERGAERIIRRTVASRQIIGQELQPGTATRRLTDDVETVRRYSPDRVIRRVIEDIEVPDDQQTVGRKVKSLASGSVKDLPSSQQPFIQSKRTVSVDQPAKISTATVLEPKAPAIITSSAAVTAPAISSSSFNSVEDSTRRLKVPEQRQQVKDSPSSQQQSFIQSKRTASADQPAITSTTTVRETKPAAIMASSAANTTPATLSSSSSNVEDAIKHLEVPELSSPIRPEESLISPPERLRNPQTVSDFLGDIQPSSTAPVATTMTRMESESTKPWTMQSASAGGIREVRQSVAEPSLGRPVAFAVSEGENGEPVKTTYYAQEYVKKI